MRCEGVHRLLVLAGGRLAGLITSTDVLRAVADARQVSRGDAETLSVAKNWYPTGAESTDLK
jgi:CBS domain-containing protein